jgi:hypothetical protein
MVMPFLSNPFAIKARRHKERQKEIIRPQGSKNLIRGRFGQ